ncbi:MAG: DHHA1 domain-containing protein [Mariniblastus sp.]|nr:DHHA1 domain-containing protein [Mariniblastus sp.]
MNVDWPRFCEVIHGANNIILTSHIRPDCDALGSCLGMAGILESLGKKVRIVCGQAVPPNLAFIDPDKKVMCINEDIKAEDFADADLHMILDTSAWKQIGPMSEAIRNSTYKKIIFDHHVGEDDIDAELFKNTTAEAVGRMCVEAAEHLGVELTPEISMPLFCALATDTGWFRFPSVSETTYTIASKLIVGGADPAKIYGDLYERETVGRVRLRGTVLARVQTELEGRLAHTYILPNDFADTGAQPTDTEDLINLALQIQGTVFAVIAVGQIDGGYKLSFRSRCKTAANEVAKQFDGGGHKAAAGAFIESDDIDEVQKQVLDYVRKELTAEFEA